MQSSKPEQSKSPAVGDRIKKTYDWWDNIASWHPEDPWYLIGAKIGVRILGIAILIALSPLILLGFLMALIVAA
ncbi:MAG: hypothetical protein AAF741_03000 [Bacteroidota bacterium]